MNHGEHMYSDHGKGPSEGSGNGNNPIFTHIDTGTQALFLVLRTSP